MRSVKIRKAELLTTLEHNRAKHVADYQTAIQVYRDDAIESLKKLVKKAQASKVGDEIELSVYLVVPRSYEEHYNTAIGMLKFSVDDTVELSMQEFQQYVEDKWHWKNEFVASTALYNSKLAK